jgi:hypothetical protein
VANAAVRRQLSKQVNEENALQQSTITMQQNSASFEATLVRDIQSAWQTFEDWQSRASATVQQTWKSVGKTMYSLVPDDEWNHFSRNNENLLDPETPLRDSDAIAYPSQDEPSVIPVRAGHLERKTKYTRTYKDSYVVVTAAGFLHEYASSDPLSADGSTPTFSLFLPTCSVGPPSSTSARSAKFTIYGKKDGSHPARSGSLKILDVHSQHAWIFRSKNRGDMMEWWNAIIPFCTIDPITGKQKDMTGPTAAAVRSAGYKGGDQDESTDEDDAAVRKKGGGKDAELPGYYPPPGGKKANIEKGGHANVVSDFNLYVLEAKSMLGREEDT